MNRLSEKIDRLQRLLIDEKKKNKIIGMCTYATLGLVSLVMTILNVLTNKGMLTYSTGIFFVLCVINILLTVWSPKGIRISMVLFSVKGLRSNDRSPFSIFMGCDIPYVP